MLRTAMRNLMAHKLRLILSGTAIVLGVAFVTGTMIYTSTLERTFTSLMGEMSTDVSVAPKAAFETGMVGTALGGAQVAVPAELVDDVREVDGVAAAAGYVQAEGVYPLDADGKVAVTGGAPGLGVSWTDQQELTAARLVEGTAPRARNEIALDSTTAEKLGYDVGDRITVLTPGPRVDATLVGVFDYGDGLAGATLTAFDLASAQELLLEPGQVSGISVAGDGVSDEELRDAVAAAVGAGYEVRTRAEQTDEATKSLEQGLSFITTFLLVFAGVALFVGSFIILNTFSMLVAQRTRELALLRALGSSRRQVTRSVLVEAVVLGLLGSTAGLGAGYGLAHGLKALMGQFGLTIDGGLVLTGATVAWGYAVGVVVTVIAAYVPARRAARVAPVAAMRDDVVTGPRPLRRCAALGGMTLFAAGAALVAGLTSEEPSAALVGIGSSLLVVAAIVLSPVLAMPFVRVAGAVLPRVAGRTGALARENALRNPRRTAATASALMVGLTLVTGFGILGASMQGSVEKLIGDTIEADYVVSAAAGQPFTAAVADELETVDGVRTVVRERNGVARFDGTEATFGAFHADGFADALHLDFLSGGPEGLAGDGLILGESTAEKEGWRLGDVVTFEATNGATAELTVGGIFEDNQGLSAVLIGMEPYQRTGGLPTDRWLYLRLDEDADRALVEKALDGVEAAYPVVSVKDRAEFVADQRGQVDQLLALVNALLVLSVLIAMLGVVNTLALSVIERTRELGLLRALGMSRRQTRRMVRLEAVLISCYGAALGVVVGGIFGAAVSRSLSGEGITTVVVPGAQLVAFLALGAVIGVVAAVAPARRAGRLKVLDAIATS